MIRGRDGPGTTLESRFVDLEEAFQKFSDEVCHLVLCKLDTATREEVRIVLGRTQRGIELDEWEMVVAALRAKRAGDTVRADRTLLRTWQRTNSATT